MAGKKKVICCAQPISGHIIPLLKIAEDLSDVYEVHFMIPSQQRHFLKKSNVNKVLIGGYNNTDEYIGKQIEAIKKINPSISISDFSISHLIAARYCKIKCIVTILRAELILGYERIHFHFDDKFSRGVESINNLLQNYSLPIIDEYKEIFVADHVLIPSIPEIDTLPKIKSKKYENVDFQFTGPLFKKVFINPMDKGLLKWIDTQKNRNGKNIVLITLGTAYGKKGLYKQLIDHLNLDANRALVVVPQDDMRLGLEKIYKGIDGIKIVNLLDIDLLDKFDVAIHHCGHGFMFHCLKNGVPSITIPTGEYDRDDNAVRLEKLNLGRRFASTVESFDINGLIESVLANDSIKMGLAKYKSKILNYGSTPYIGDFVRRIEEILDKKAV